LCLTNSCTLTKQIAALPDKNQLLNEAKAVLKNKKSLFLNYHAYMAFVECVKPPIALVILGAGNDVIPLTKISAILGWHITIVDGRPNYATVQRFPTARKVLVAKPHEVLANLKINEWTAFVLMTHNYSYEIVFLRELLPLHASYIGVLGPKKKLERMLGELKEAGNTITSHNLDAIHGPAGLDIGSDNADEIALSIIAEIQAVFSTRNANPLKYKSSLIHSL
jgi:xanthine dehydrogenase accessory factor